MAGNNIVINSKFKPFSYEELIRPYEKYGEAYREQETLLSDLESLAALMENIAKTDPGSDAARLYESYNKAILDQANSLAKDGLKQGSRKQLLDLKKLYNTEIAPIGIAAQRKAALIEEQMQKKAADSTIEFDTHYREISIDDLIDDPLKSYNYISGNQVALRSSLLLYSELMKNIGQDPSPEDIGRLMEPIKKTLKLEFNIQDGDAKMNNLLSNFAESGYGVALEAYQQLLIRLKDYNLRKEEFDFRKGNSTSEASERTRRLELLESEAALTEKINELRLESSKLEVEALKLANELSLINTGKLPYHVDNDGTQYFGNGHFAWTVDAEGVKSVPVAIKSKEEIKAGLEEEERQRKLENEEVIYLDAAPVVVKDANGRTKEIDPSRGSNKIVFYNTLTSDEQKFVRETINKYWPGVDVSNFRIYKSGNKYKIDPILKTLKTTKKEREAALKELEPITASPKLPKTPTDTTLVERVSPVDTVGLTQ